MNDNERFFKKCLEENKNRDSYTRVLVIEDGNVIAETKMDLESIRNVIIKPLKCNGCKLDIDEYRAKREDGREFVAIMVIGIIGHKTGKEILYD